MQNLLIIGGDHIDRIKYATRLAQKLLCQLSKEEACERCVNCQRITDNIHPNVVLIEPDKSDSAKEDRVDGHSQLIKIEQIRKIIVENHKTNFETGVNIFIISHMHKATKSAANALLKVFEETSRKKIIIALAPSRATVLPTIASRLICHALKPKPKAELVCSDDIRQKILLITKTHPRQRFPLCEKFSTEREQLLFEFDELIHACHVMLMNKEISAQLVLRLRDALDKSISHLKRNLNPRLVTEKLVLREWPMATS